MTTHEILLSAASVRPKLALLTEAEKNNALEKMADALIHTSQDFIDNKK